MPGIQSLFNESNLKTRIRWDCCCKRTWLLYRVRIGVTVAKTLAYALNTKLYGVSSLKALAATIDTNDKRIIVPIFDARRQRYIQDYINMKIIN